MSRYRYRCSNTECERYEEFLGADEVVSIDAFGGALYHGFDQGSLLDPVVGRPNVRRIGTPWSPADFPVPCGPVLTIDGPCRIRLRRLKGWRKPEGSVVVTRPSRWGNPYIVCADFPTCTKHDLECVASAYSAVDKFRHALLYPISGDLPVPDLDAIRQELRGKDLACWCRLDHPCHADVLLELANR
ncbi:MAG TPA: DUF4326 domain-containing protein [Acidimicrobiales bacterium]